MTDLLSIAYRGRVQGRTLIPLLEGGAFFEAPQWRDGRWWVSDFYREAVYTVSTEGTEELVLEVPHQASGLGWLPDGSLLIVSMTDQRVLRRDRAGHVSVHADLGASPTVRSTTWSSTVTDAPGWAASPALWAGMMAGLCWSAPRPISSRPTAAKPERPFF